MHLNIFRTVAPLDGCFSYADRCSLKMPEIKSYEHTTMPQSAGAVFTANLAA